MCGITGIFNFDQRPFSLEVLKKMTDIISHRGPDGEGVWADTYIGLGHRRLAIIDLSEAARQPMNDGNDRYVITYNGEVYNFQELRAELETLGYKFKSHTDSEVVLKSWCEWGTDALLKFNGMFAFAIWDKKEKRLFLARDRCGIKPLYYWYQKNRLVFGSEVKSIIQHPEFSPGVSIPALNEYFSFQNIFSDLTLFVGIKLLPAAHYLEFGLEQGLIRKQQYWDYCFE